MKVCTDSCLFGAWVANKIEKKIINPKAILDIGTGTGLLSLMLAQKTKAQIHAVEIDNTCFGQASANFNASLWSKSLHAFHSDIKEWKAPGKYDLVISNPPFYENDLLPEENGKLISKHSSTMRLGELLQIAKKLLNDDGKFAVLIPWHRTKWLEDAASASLLFIKEKTEVRQTPRHNYFRTMLLLQTTKVKAVTAELTIKNNIGYTPEFIKLLKDYYLHM